MLSRALLLASLLALALFFWSGWLGDFNFWDSLRKTTNNELSELAEPLRESFLPPPLRAEKESPTAALTLQGIIVSMNRERADAGLQALAENWRLNSAAAAKVDDMFGKQYFEHVSPSGVSASDLAEGAGYAYIAIGENLALGNFADDEELVAAWMASPGHRANILKPAFTEIGVAARKGIFDGEIVWLAVQIFGRPLSLCPALDESLKDKIKMDQARLDEIKLEIERLRGEIESMRPKRGEAYNNKVQAYNALISGYNALLAEVKSSIAAYNNQVRSFNECVAQ